MLSGISALAQFSEFHRVRKLGNPIGRRTVLELPIDPPTPTPSLYKTLHRVRKLGIPLGRRVLLTVF